MISRLKISDDDEWPEQRTPSRPSSRPPSRSSSKSPSRVRFQEPSWRFRYEGKPPPRTKSGMSLSQPTPLQYTGDGPARRPVPPPQSQQPQHPPPLPVQPAPPKPTMPKPTLSGLSDDNDSSGYAGQSGTRPHGPKASEQRITGLINPHNWCYANSTIQSLRMSPGFGRELSTKDWETSYPLPRRKDEVSEHPRLMARIVANLFYWMDEGSFTTMKAQTLMVSSSPSLSTSTSTQPSFTAALSSSPVPDRSFEYVLTPAPAGLFSFHMQRVGGSAKVRRVPTAGRTGIHGLAHGGSPSGNQQET